jgi:hypothetical protein
MWKAAVAGAAVVGVAVLLSRMGAGKAETPEKPTVVDPQVCEYWMWVYDPKAGFSISDTEMLIHQGTLADTGVAIQKFNAEVAKRGPAPKLESCIPKCGWRLERRCSLSPQPGHYKAEFIAHVI